MFQEFSKKKSKTGAGISELFWIYRKETYKKMSCILETDNHNDHEGNPQWQAHLGTPKTAKWGGRPTERGIIWIFCRRKLDSFDQGVKNSERALEYLF